MQVDGVAQQWLGAGKVALPCLMQAYQQPHVGQDNRVCQVHCRSTQPRCQLPVCLPYKPLMMRQLVCSNPTQPQHLLVTESVRHPNTPHPKCCRLRDVHCVCPQQTGTDNTTVPSADVQAMQAACLSAHRNLWDSSMPAPYRQCNHPCIFPVLLLLLLSLMSLAAV